MLLYYFFKNLKNRKNVGKSLKLYSRKYRIWLSSIIGIYYISIKVTELCKNLVNNKLPEFKKRLRKFDIQSKYTKYLNFSLYFANILDFISRYVVEREIVLYFCFTTFSTYSHLSTASNSLMLFS